ncbi:MAG: stage II sporulation protein D [Eubacteriales bacterium]|nr:stage II sporulation protein D [Eubacteriales bacterium]
MKPTRRILLSAALLLTALLWRMLGAPLSSADWGALGTPLWQARALLPQRALRVFSLWTLASGEAAAASAEETALLRVFHPDTGELADMPMEEYVCAAVAAEMPASYHLEALKAQAVAARTRALQGCALCEGANVCTDSAHCQAFADEARRRELWGESCGAYTERVRQAVRETAGQILTYEGKPITVLYHAISGGHTEDAQAVFSQSLPYLVGVESAGEEDARGCYEDATFSYEEAVRLLEPLSPGLTADALQSTLAIATHTATGRVSTLLLGGKEIEATELRRALGLRSTWFTLSATASGLTFHQRGYGHGVGMSQVGANAMAAAGETYQRILAHYYQGTELSALEERHSLSTSRPT